MTAGWDRARRGDFATRLWRKDPTLWSADPAHQAVAARRLGWLDLPERLRAQTVELRHFAAQIADEELTHAVLLGMGGSSLAPEVMRRMLGVRPGALELTVLDDSSPAAVRAVAGSHVPRRTLFVVSSKSGTTLEVTCFERYFFEWVRQVQGDRAGHSFVAVTDPGTPLPHASVLWSIIRQRSWSIFSLPLSISARSVLPITSRRAVWLDQAMACR